MSKDNLTDLGVGGGALTVPLWLHQLADWAQAFVMIGGAVLLALRLIIAWRDVRKGKGKEA